MTSPPPLTEEMLADLSVLGWRDYCAKWGVSQPTYYFRRRRHGVEIVAAEPRKPGRPPNPPGTYKRPPDRKIIFRAPPSPSAADIRAARAVAGHSQRAAGAAIGVGFRTWQQWEGSKHAMPPAMLQLYLLLTGQTTVARARTALQAPAQVD